ncbi:MAG: hypothetical protein ABI852_14370 [Gemmatimonadaceae bacterium]
MSNPGENERMNTRWISSLLLSAAAVFGTQAAHAQSAATNLAGEWRFEFRSEPSPTDPAVKSAPWLNFTVTLVQVDSTIGGAMRSDGPSGQFGCKRRGDDVCSAGRMRLSWDEQDWQTFEFKLTPGEKDKGAGKAEIRFPTGATDRYSFTMVRQK